MGYKQLLQRPSEITEPSGRLWVTLKSFFVASLILIMVKVGILIYLCVLLKKLMDGNLDSHMIFMETDNEHARKETNYLFPLTITIIHLMTFQLVTGAIGIVTLRINYLYICQGLMLCNAILSIILSLMTQGPSSLLPFLNFWIQIIIILLNNKIIKMINQANYELV